MDSIKKNFSWNIILTVAGRIFPLLVFPYVTRVLGVTRWGSIQFADSVVTYFTVFALLGINSVGVREIAKAKENREKLSQAFSSLLFLTLFTTIIAVIVLVVLIQFIPTFESHSNLLYIGISNIICAALLIEWFYRGLEDFRYITIRTLAIRCVYVVSVFLLIKKEDDYVLFFILSAIVYLINVFINLVYSKKFADITFKNLNIKPYIKPFFILGVYSILTNMYSSFNVVFLGVQCGDTEVGFYTTATKLYFVILSVFTAFTTVMMPRMSSLLSEGKKEEFLIMASKSMDILLLFCFPLIILSEVYAPELIRIIAGPGYEGAILPMRIIMPFMLVIGYEQIIVIQMLMPLEKDNAIMINSGVGAGIAVLLNFLIVKKMGAVGSSIVWICCELGVAASAQFFVGRYAGYRIPIKKIVTKALLYFPLLVLCAVMSNIIANSILSVLLGALFVIVYVFVLELYIIKTPVLVTNYNVFITKIKNYKRVR